MALATFPPRHAAPVLPGFDRCERLAAGQPESEEASRCFDETGAALKQMDQAKAKLQELLRRHPGSPWPWFFLVYRDADVEELSRVAAAFASRRNAWGEVSARVNLYRLLFNAGRVAEAGAQADRALQVAQASSDPKSIARARVLKARYLWGTSQDLEGAYLLLRQAEPALFPKGPYSAQRECLLALANLNLDLGRYQEGLEAFRRLTELATAKQDSFTEANARFGMARAVLDQTGELPSEEGRRETARLAQHGARRRSHGPESRTILANVHLILGSPGKG